MGLINLLGVQPRSQALSPLPRWGGIKWVKIGVGKKGLVLTTSPRTYWSIRVNLYDVADVASVW